MKPLQVIATVLALSAAGGSFYYLQKKRSQTAVAVKKMQEQPRTRKPVVWRSIANPEPAAPATRPEETSTASQPSAGTSPPPASETDSPTPEGLPSLSMEELCAADWQQAASVELSLLRHQVAQGNFAMTSDCARSMFDANQGGDLGWFVAQCQPSSQMQIENRDRCVDLALVYRAFAIGNVVRAPEQLSQVEMATLANILTRNMTNLKNADTVQLDQSIAVANEIISREPDAYGAYKAKAVSMLLKEARYKIEIDDEEFEQTLTEMASFETFDPTFSLREENRDDGTAPTQAVDNADPDILRLPFLRQMATGNFEALIEDAEEFIGEYPDSPVGYHFLAQGLWRSGEKEEALQAIRNALEQDTDNALLLELLTKAADRPAVDYLSDIRVELDSETSM